MKRDPLDDARAAGLRVQVAELGDWFPATLLSEYDHAARAIRINAAVLRAACRALGDAERERLVRAAVAHELYHHEVAEGRIAGSRDRASTEREAERFARMRYAIDPEPFERVVRR